MNVSGFQLKITQHSKNPDDLKLKEKRQIIDASTKMTEMLGLSDNDFKTAVIRVLQQATIIMLETNAKIESLSKDNEAILLYVY